MAIRDLFSQPTVTSSLGSTAATPVQAVAPVPLTIEEIAVAAVNSLPKPKAGGLHAPGLPASPAEDLVRMLKSPAFGPNSEPSAAAVQQLGQTASSIPQEQLLQFLKDLGLDPGQSLTDDKSKAAIRTLQEDAGLPVTGDMDLSTVLALAMAEANKKNPQFQAQSKARAPVGGGDGNGGRQDYVPRRQSAGPPTDPQASTGGGPVSKNLKANQKEAYAAAIAGDPAKGVPPLSPTAAKALVANMTGESLGKPNDHHWDVHHMSQGIVQWDPQRAAAIQKHFGKLPKDMSVAEQTKAAVWEINTNSRFASTKAALNGGGSAAGMIDKLVRNFECPANPGGEVAKRTGHLQKLAHLDS